MGLSAVSRALEPAIVTAFSDRKKEIILHQKCRNQGYYNTGWFNPEMRSRAVL